MKTSINKLFCCMINDSSRASVMRLLLSWFFWRTKADDTCKYQCQDARIGGVRLNSFIPSYIRYSDWHQIIFHSSRSRDRESTKRANPIKKMKDKIVVLCSCHRTKTWVSLRNVKEKRTKLQGKEAQCPPICVRPWRGLTFVKEADECHWMWPKEGAFHPSFFLWCIHKLDIQVSGHPSVDGKGDKTEWERSCLCRRGSIYLATYLASLLASSMMVSFLDIKRTWFLLW